MRQKVLIKSSCYIVMICLLSAWALSPNNKKNDFVQIEAGTYWVGGTQHPTNPSRQVTLKSFQIATKEITNRQFQAFVLATGYVTDAERFKDALVYGENLEEFEWKEDSTANWRFPQGKDDGGIENKLDHPVTCISFMDVQAYCKWAKVRLPTLDEWEVACRASSSSRYFWGKKQAHIKQYGNIWEGKDHQQKPLQDVYVFTSPVGVYKPNAWGLYDMYGNVFEFCSDRFSLIAEIDHLACARGGSWWCSSNSCDFFNSVDIGRVHKRASFANQGFRVVR